MCTADRTVHSQLNQPVDMLKVFAVPWTPPKYNGFSGF